MMPACGKALKLLIIDELKCKSIMQTTTEDWGKQTHEQPMIKMNTGTHILFEFAFWAVSFMGLQCAETCLFVIYCNGFLSGLWLFMSVKPKNEVINCTLLTTQLKLGIWGVCTHSDASTQADHHHSGWKLSQHPFIHNHSAGSLKLLWWAARTRTRGWTSTSTRVCSQATCNLTKPFPPVRTDTRKQKHTPHLMTPSLQRSGPILNCMLRTGICKLSKLQMIAGSFLAYDYRECNQVNNSPIFSIRQKPGR